MKPKVLIGCAHLHRPQRYERRDPEPHIPFAEDGPSNIESVVCGTFAMLAFIAMLGVAYIASTL